MMNAIIINVIPGSPASKTIISQGDILRKINGNTINDILDYKYFSYDDCLLLELTGTSGRIKLVRIHKPAGADVGLEFDTFLMDRERSCANKCIFCFIDQLPKGMRETLYYKDDDLRLSFFQGNYITLTNLSKRDIDRIIKLRVSPVNVSVHTFDPELRAFMLGIKNGAAGIKAFITLAKAGIRLNCQIVCCPGINDGKELYRTLDSLFKLGSCINSVAIVPVGLTKHRQGLAELDPFDRENAIKTVRQVSQFGELSLKERGSRVFYCADELYIKAGLKLPPYSYYEEYAQLENGVGMMRLFIAEFMDALKRMCSRKIIHKKKKITVVTGMAASKYLTKLLKITSEKCGKIKAEVCAIRNEFFGDNVTVSGLVTGGDIIKQLRGRELGSRLLIPRNMLKHGENVFLDDVTVAEVTGILGVTVRVVEQDGADFLRAILGN
jgi:putative radical SAM enzyme (TIGR03279 family)